MLFWLGVFVPSTLCEHLALVQMSHYRWRTRLVHRDFPFLSRSRLNGTSFRFGTTYVCY